MTPRWLAIVLIVCASRSTAAEAPHRRLLQRVVFEGKQGVVLANDKLELTILTEGGSFANLVLRDDPQRLGPFSNPFRLAREAGEKPLWAYSMGHFVCVDGFGPVSPEEQAAGLPTHGEAHRRRWTISQSGKQGDTATVTFSVTLPLVQEVLTRRVRMVDGENVIYIESELENLLAFDRPVCWAEHVTIGSPFLEPGNTVVDMSARQAKTRNYPLNPTPLPQRLASFRDFVWPLAPTLDGKVVDLRAAPENPRSTDHTTSVMDPQRELVFVTALHTEKRLLLAYIFKPEEYPWVQNWEYYPPPLKLVRGLEFATQPFDVPRREVIQSNSIFGAPVYRWLPARSKIATRFLLFFARTPEGIQKVDDVRIEGRKLIIEDRRTGTFMTLSASSEI